jgi:glutamate 5-kinase
MVTKVRAARLAARSGAGTVIASGRREQVVEAISRGNKVGTLLVPVQEPQAARKRWLAGQLQARGSLTLDDGAVRVLREQGRSLLAVGVCGVKGSFSRGEAVVCLDRSGREVARGLANYSAQETERIMGQPSSRIESMLGYVDEEELIHRDNLVLL